MKKVISDEDQEERCKIAWGGKCDGMTNTMIKNLNSRINAKPSSPYPCFRVCTKCNEDMVTGDRSDVFICMDCEWQIELDNPNLSGENPPTTKTEKK